MHLQAFLRKPVWFLWSHQSLQTGRGVLMLLVNWELMDAAINIYRSRSTEDQSKIAAERLRRVQQNVILDIFGLLAFSILARTSPENQFAAI